MCPPLCRPAAAGARHSRCYNRRAEAIIAQQSTIRNFCIVAHIDHGKSTLADRILELTAAVDPRKMREQFLDTMDLERERGITIKMQAVRLRYRARDGTPYDFGLIDTPGHVDFSYEVSRSLKACEGAVLLVDAAQGVEAQTIANLNLAVEEGLEIIPVINKIDLPVARVKETEDEILALIGGIRDEILRVSAKTGEGVEALLEAIVKRVPPPGGDPEAPLQALIFDSHYDPFRGIVAYIRVVNGAVKVGEHIRMMSTGKRFEVSGCGLFRPDMQPAAQLAAGDVGYLFAGIKDIGDARVGDTITLDKRPAATSVPGFRQAKPLVFCGFYASDNEEYDNLKSALARLSLNDSALHYEPESSEALGFGFRCGFLGLLHMEIVQERLEREYALDLVATAPSVAFEIELTDGRTLTVDNPARVPAADKIAQVREPFLLGTILSPVQYQSALIDLCKERRGELKDLQYLTADRVNIRVFLPLSEVLYEFYDALKTQSHGLASFDYEVVGFRESDLVRVDILINQEKADALSFMAHRQRAQQRARAAVETLRRTIPRHLFAVPIQAAIGSTIIARETIPALRKDVLAKCYGGDITRKRKLLEKQRKGKQRMRSIGSVSVPQEAFLAVLGQQQKKGRT